MTPGLGGGGGVPVAWNESSIATLESERCGRSRQRRRHRHADHTQPGHGLSTPGTSSSFPLPLSHSPSRRLWSSWTTSSGCTSTTYGPGSAFRKAGIEITTDRTRRRVRLDEQARLGRPKPTGSATETRRPMSDTELQRFVDAALIGGRRQPARRRLAPSRLVASRTAAWGARRATPSSSPTQADRTHSDRLPTGGDCPARRRVKSEVVV